jgi:hypothetical protein
MVCLPYPTVHHNATLKQLLDTCVSSMIEEVRSALVQLQ